MATIAESTGDGSVSIGRIYSRAFSTIGRNPGVTLGLALLFGAIPGLAMSWLMLNQPNPVGPGATSMAFAAIMFLNWVGSIVIAALTQAMLTRVTVAQSEGRRASFGESLGAGFSVLLPLIAVAIVIGIGAALGMLLLIVPGVMLYVAWSVASPALVEERHGVFGSLGRSRELTRGHRWKVFGALLLLVIIYWLISAVAGVLGIATVAGGGSIDLMGPGFLITSVVLGTLTNVIWGTVQASTYVELREAAEGPAHAQLEDVFA